MRKYYFSMSVTAALAALLLLSAADTARAGASVKGGPPMRLIYNMEEAEFFAGTFGPPTPENIDHFVDVRAALGITDLFICVNDQRTNYRSDVWESYWDGYDPKAGDDQPFWGGVAPTDSRSRAYILNAMALSEQGCDYGKRMIDRARQDHVSPWISLRMNDDHDPNAPDRPGHSTFWRSHPEWHLPYGLDYEQPQVREHYMKLVREVCARYDMDGLELDFLRFWLYFRPGREHEGGKLMEAFVEQARTATDGAARRLGHPVKLAVRVPTTPWIARRHGLDAVAWAKAGLVDMIIPSPFWPSVDGDIPIETWKGMLIGTNVEVALGMEAAIFSGAGGHRCPMMHEEMRGVMVSGLHRGAEAIYLFNAPWFDDFSFPKDQASYTAFFALPRRHALTVTRPWAAGEPGQQGQDVIQAGVYASSRRYLPYTGTHGVFRLYIGPKSLAEQKARVELVVPDHDEPLEVRVNGIPCPWSTLADPEYYKAAGWKQPEPKRHIYDVPPDALSDGYNLIEVNAEQDVTINWVEISVR